MWTSASDRVTTACREARTTTIATSGDSERERETGDEWRARRRVLDCRPSRRASRDVTPYIFIYLVDALVDVRVDEHERPRHDGVP